MRGDHDPGHCGACDHACPPGVACTDGVCVPACAADLTVCGESCVQTANDELHCGACDAACPIGQPCVYGECVATTVHHLLIGGQSLSTGSYSNVVSLTQPYANLSFNPGVRTPADNLISFIPLIETQVGIEGETTTLVSDPGNYGFEFTDSSGAPPAITEIAIVDPTTVRVTLAAPPTGGNRRLRYAYTGVAGQPAGPMTGPRGNLRDSDPTPIRNGYLLYNWAVHFDVPVE